jgi:sigma-B regulation protein RsbU (phosphoserine phosphatase)
MLQVADAVRQFVGDAEQSDDLTMLAIHYTPKVEKDILNETLTLKNDPRQVNQLSTFVKDVLARALSDEKQRGEIRLAVEEAVVNVMEYAYPTGVEGDVTIDARFDGQWVKFVISDSGIAFDPTKASDADTTLSAEDRPIGGLGILLVRRLMDSINYERVDGRNILTLKKKVNNSNS